MKSFSPAKHVLKRKAWSNDEAASIFEVMAMASGAFGACVFDNPTNELDFSKKASFDSSVRAPVSVFSCPRHSGNTSEPEYEYQLKYNIEQGLSP